MRLTKRNYFGPKATREYMSVSQFKAFEKCQFTALEEIQGKYVRPMTTSLLIGSYVDAYFEGALDRFEKEHPEIFTFKLEEQEKTREKIALIAPELVTSTGNWKPGCLTKARNMFPELFASKQELKADYVHANTIIERIKRDPTSMRLLSGKKQVIMQGVINGVNVKIKIDSLLPDMIVDQKIMKDFEPIYVQEQGRLPWFEAWRYDLQGAVYQEIVRQNTGKKLPFVLLGATKEPVPDIDAVEIEQDLLDYELSKFAENAPFYDAIKKGIVDAERCEKCDHCKDTKVITRIRKSGEFINE